MKRCLVTTLIFTDFSDFTEIQLAVCCHTFIIVIFFCAYQLYISNMSPALAIFLQCAQWPLKHGHLILHLDENRVPIRRRSTPLRKLSQRLS